MARQPQKQASQNAVTGQQFASEANNNATQIGNWLTPTLESTAANPQGFGQDWVNASKTQAGQIAGSAAATGKHNLDLMAERTGNSAGFAPAQDEAVRGSQSALSNAMLGIDTENAQAKMAEKEAALGQLGSQFGENLGAETGNLNASTDAVKTEADAGKSGWFQNFLNTITALNPSGSKGNFAFGH